MSKSNNHPKTKPCKFCNNGAYFSPLQELERHEVGIYFCHLCQAEYLYFNDGSPASCSLYTVINDRMYRWSRSTADTAQLWWIQVPGEPGVRKNEGLVHLIGFDKNDTIPCITPTNINEKIRTWLVFL